MADGPASVDKGVVLVSGVGSPRGLGAAIARRFAADGHPVAIAGRNAETLTAAQQQLQDSGVRSVMAVGDASQAADMDRFVDLARTLGRIEVAVHNAGSNRPSPFLGLSEASFEEHWRAHALGGFQLAHATVPGLLQGGGSLLFTGASGSLRGRAHYAAFGAAKGALRNLSQALAREFWPQGIHVAHVIIDGGIAGDRLLSRLPHLEGMRKGGGLLEIDAIAEAYWMLHQQDRTAWTGELDLRPWSEPF